MFLYWSQAGSGRWQISTRIDSDGSDLLQEVQSTPADQHPRSLAFQVEGLKWKEWADFGNGCGSFLDRNLVLARPVEPDTFTLHGLRHYRHLDGVYTRRTLLVIRSPLGPRILVLHQLHGVSMGLPFCDAFVRSVVRLRAHRSPPTSLAILRMCLSTTVSAGLPLCSVGLGHSLVDIGHACLHRGSEGLTCR